MQKLPRLEGTELKSSNERIVSEFGHLAIHVVRKYARSYHLNEDQTADLLQSVLLELFKAPASYRNYRGISLMLKHKTIYCLRRVSKTEKEIAVGLFQEPTYQEPFGQPNCESGLGAPEPAVPCEDDLTSVEVGLISKHLDSLSSSERSIVSLIYGLEGNEVFQEQCVARKLGRDKFWVRRKHQAGIMKLRCSLRFKNQACKAFATSCEHSAEAKQVTGPVV